MWPAHQACGLQASEAWEAKDMKAQPAGFGQLTTQAKMKPLTFLAAEPIDSW